MDFILGVIASLAVALFGAAVGFLLGRQQYRWQVVWQAKREAYITLVASLADMRRLLAMEAEQDLGEVEYAEAAWEEQRANSREARQRLDGIRTVATLTVSSEARDVLLQLSRELSQSASDAEVQQGNWYRENEMEYAAMGRALTAIEKLAREELKLDP